METNCKKEALDSVGRLCWLQRVMGEARDVTCVQDALDERRLQPACRLVFRIQSTSVAHCALLRLKASLLPKRPRAERDLYLVHLS